MPESTTSTPRHEYTTKADDQDDGNDEVIKYRTSEYVKKTQIIFTPQWFRYFHSLSNGIIVLWLRKVKGYLYKKCFILF